MGRKKIQISRITDERNRQVMVMVMQMVKMVMECSDGEDGEADGDWRW